MQFLYFIPGPLTSDDLSGVGLAHLGPASCLARSGSEIAGPDGESGGCMRSMTRCASATLPTSKPGGVVPAASIGSVTTTRRSQPRHHCDTRMRSGRTREVAGRQQLGNHPSPPAS